MTVKTLYLGACMTNCYIVNNNNTECIIVDPACDGDLIISEMQNLNLKPTAILLTHGHFDHIYAIPDLLEKYPNVRVYAHKDEVQYLRNTSLNLSQLFGESFVYTGEVLNLSDNDIVSEAGIKFKVIHTPGHTLGSVCYLTEDTIFSGDTLFASTIGRTDFPNGSFDTIIKSLQKLKKLEGDYTVYPGHNASTTLSCEKQFNEYMLI